MFDDYDTDELENEITVDEVVVHSLDKVEGGHVEEEKEELNKKIIEMKKILEMRRSGQIKQKFQEQPDERETTPKERIASGNHILYGNGGSPSGVRTPTQIPSATVSDMSYDASPTHVLPSKKRSGSTANTEAAPRPVKTQRSTPTREIQPVQPVSQHSTTSTWSNGSKEDPIDLTKLNGSDHIEDAASLIGEIRAGSHSRSLNSPTRRTGQGKLTLPGTRGNQWMNSINSASTVQVPQGTIAPNNERQVKTEHKFPTTALRSYFHDGDSKAQPMLEPKTENRMPGTWQDSWEQGQDSMSPSGVAQHIPVAWKVDSLQDIVNRTSAFSQPGQSITDVMNESLDPTLILSDSYARAANIFNTVATDSVEKDKDIEKLLQHIQATMSAEDKILARPPTALNAMLYPHQMFALAWMRKMESQSNKGGILADDMGLGKTVSTISLMLANRSKNSTQKTNLIVGPLSLIHQWHNELGTKIRESSRGSIFIYHNKKASVTDLLKYEFVLTTYGTLAAEWKRLDRFQEEMKGRNIDWGDSGFLDKFPLLHQKARWYRVVLDEAQCIKNSKTKSAKSAYALKSTFRWCLTGTPMMNGVHELYSLLCFLRIRPYCNWLDFLKQFGCLFGKKGSPRSQAMEQLQAILKATTLRRSKKTKINGQPIIRLPEKIEEDVHVELSKDERDYYKQLEEKAQVQFNRYLRDGGVGKHYAAILVQLLRLRQACCHPHLNLDVDDPVSTNPHMEEVVKNLSSEVVTGIKAKDAFQCMICDDLVQEPSFYAPCGHYGCNNCLINAISEAEKRNIQAGRMDDEGNSRQGSTCPCCEKPVDMSNAFTYTAFQTVHMPEKLKYAEEERQKLLKNGYDSDDSDDSDAGALAEDANEAGDLRGFVVPDDYDSHSDTDEEGHERQRKKMDEHKKRKQAGVDRKRAVKAREKLENTAMTNIKPSMLRELRKRALRSSKAHKSYFDYLSQTWQPSAKTTRCVELLQEIDVTREKTIVFSQWTMLLDLVQVAMRKAGLGRPLRYDGSMDAHQRASAVEEFRGEEFRKDSGVSVMLVSLKAGNAGLNLTAASRVIIMDPFWNPYIEKQAIDRTYRIGQTREVHVYRILTEATVEDRIVALQEQKEEMIESALDENKALMISKLRPEELRVLLFGR